jgi:hypothetical protein
MHPRWAVAVALLAAVLIFAPAAGAATWSAPQAVAADAFAVAMAPRPVGALLAWTQQTGPSTRRLFVAASDGPDAGRGSAPPGASNAINTPRIAVDEHGGVVAVWSEPIRAGPERNHASVVAANQHPTGEWTTPVRLSAPGAPAADPQVAGNEHGEAVAAWRSRAHVEVALRAPDGRFGSRQVLPGRTRQVPGAPALAIAPSGEAIVAWVNGVIGRFSVILAAVRPPGGVFGSPQRIAHSTSPPIVAIAADGEATLAWCSGDCERGRPRLLTAVKPAGSRRFAPGPSPRGEPGGEGAWKVRGVAYDAQGTLTVAWDEFEPFAPGGLSSGTQVAVADRPRGATFGPARIYAAPSGAVLAVAPSGAGVLLFRRRADPFEIYAVTRPAPGPWGARRLLWAQFSTHAVVAIDARLQAYAAWLADDTLQLTRTDLTQ